MTTLTIEIDDKNLTAVKQFIEELGLKYEVEEQDDVIFSDELKSLLDERYQEIIEGRVEMISAEDSKVNAARIIEAAKK